MKTLTVFTPTYNRAHTIVRTYESLCIQTCMDFEWLVIDDGSTDNTEEVVKSWIIEKKIPIRYIKKANGGLYTGYNVAYENIETELSVCIDSDDFMPNNAVELIITHWKGRDSDKYVGMIGLDYYLDGNPIGGKFPDNYTEAYLLDMVSLKIHRGDAKQVMRTQIMKNFIPLVGFPGEKNLNPVLLLYKANELGPLLVINENLCYVDYQVGKDSMSGAIFKQYINSPRSFAMMRKYEMVQKRNTVKRRLITIIHYVSSCIIAKDRRWLKDSPKPVLTVLLSPLGLLLYIYIKHKAK